MSKPRILVVDDTPANIKILADLLRKDYLLSVATSGRVERSSRANGASEKLTVEGV